MLEPLDRALLLALPAAWTLGTAWWARRVAERSGRPAVARPRTRVERAFPLVWLAWLGAALLAALLPEPCALGCLAEPGALRFPAMAAEALAFGLAAWASRTLGASWRIGVDEEAPGPLVTAGPYRWTRNPIFEAMLLALLGLVVWVPALPLAALWAASLLLVRAQAAREERFLAARFGAAYEAYAARTGRWAPRLPGRTRDGRT